MSSTGVGSRRTALDVAVQVVGRLVNLMAGVVVVVVLTRALGETAYGEWATALAILQIAGFIGDAGLEQVAVRRAAAEPERERDWMGGLLAFRLVVALPVALACAGAQLLIADTPEMRVAGVVLSGTQVFAALNATRIAFQLRVRNDLSIVVLSINSALWTAGVLFVAASDEGLVAFAVAFLIAAAVSTIVGGLLGIRMLAPRLREIRLVLSELIRVGTPVAISSVLMAAYLRIDQVLLYEIGGAREAGLYGAVTRILDSAQLLPSAVMTTLFPAIAAAWPGEPARVRELSQTAAEYLAIFSLPVLGFTLVAADPIVRALFGTSFADAAPALPVLMAVFVVISFAFLTGYLVLTLGLQRRFAWYAAGALVFNIAINLVLIPRYGLMGAAWSTLATEALIAGLALRLVLKTMALRPSLGRLGRIVAAAALQTAAVALADRAGVPLGGLVAVAAVVYPAALLGLGGVRLAEIRSVLRRPAS